MAHEVVCFHCSARNRAPEGWGRLIGKCKECGTALLAPVKQNSTESESNHRSSSESASLFLFKSLVVLIIVGISYLSFVGWSNKETVLSILKQLRWLPFTIEQYIESALPKQSLEQKETLPKEARPIKKLPPAVTQRSGVIWNKTLLLPQAPFQNPNKLRLRLLHQTCGCGNESDAMAIYVVGGQDLEVLVPLGVYKMKYAYGETWRGEHHLFGSGELTAVEEMLESFDFSASYEGFNGYTVRLIPHAEGNPAI